MKLKATEINRAIERIISRTSLDPKGLSRAELVKADLCALCPVESVSQRLRTHQDQNEYQISALCQNCQDEIFRENGEE